MANKSKQKGTRAETAVVKALKSMGLKAERKALSGNKDQGDIKLIHNDLEYTIEVKGGAMTANPNRSQLTEWIRQAAIESGHANTKHRWFLIVVRYRRKIEDADVWYISSGHICHCYLDDLLCAIDTM